MRLSDLQGKDIVELTEGRKIGSIIDVHINNEGKMEGIIVEKTRFFISMFTNKNEVEIRWNQIEKIGEDVILVNLNN